MSDERISGLRTDGARVPPVVVDNLVASLERTAYSPSDCVRRRDAGPVRIDKMDTTHALRAAPRGVRRSGHAGGFID